MIGTKYYISVWIFTISGYWLAFSYTVSSLAIKLILNIIIFEFLKVPSWNSGARAPFLKTAAKAEALSVQANKIKAFLGGTKLQMPVVTRWNFYYESYSGLLEVLKNSDKKDELNNLIRNIEHGDLL